MLDLSNHHRHELTLALDDRIDYLDNAIRKIDERLKVVDRALSGQIEVSVPVSPAIMREARAKSIAHLRTTIECYHLLGSRPSVQATVLMSELNLKAS